MKVTVCQINSEYIHSSLAAWLLCAAVERDAPTWEVTVTEGTVNEREDVLLDRLLASGADVVAFCTYIWNRGRVLSLCRSLRRCRPDTRLILGGPEADYDAPGIFRDADCVDFVLSGEGEASLPALLSALAGNGDGASLSGVCRQTDRGVHIAPPAVLASDPPDPYSDAYFASLNGRITYIETSRGCPYRCAYCLSSVSGGVRFFDIDEMKRRILKLARSGTKTVKFVDRTFNADRRRAETLFAFLIEGRKTGQIPAGVTFHFEIEGELLSDTTLALLKDAPAGLFQFEIGVQSLRPDTLRAIGRNGDTRRLCEVIRVLSAEGNIHIHTDLIAGLPEEDLSSFRGSFNGLWELSPHKVQLGFLKLLHGAAMREEPERFPCEYEKEPPYQVAATPWLSQEDLRELKTVCRANDAVLSSGRFSLTVRYLRSVTGMSFYALARSLGNAIGSDRVSLDGLTEVVYRQALTFPGVTEDALIPVMLRDRLASNRGCHIPPCLRTMDPILRKIAARLSASVPLAVGVRRCIAICPDRRTVLWADYLDADRDPVTGRYPVHEFTFQTEFYK